MDKPTVLYGIHYTLERGPFVQEFETTTLATCAHEALAKFEQHMEAQLTANEEMGLTGVQFDVIAVAPVAEIGIQ